MYWSYGGLIVLVAVSFYCDASTRKIPNRLTMGGAIYGFAVYGIQGGWSGLTSALAGFALGFGAMLVLYAAGAVGAGDVKLFGAIGAITGVEFVLYGMMNSLLLAGVIGFGMLLVRKETVRRVRAAWALLFSLIVLRDVQGLKRYKQASAITFPFMYAVVPAVAVTAVYCAPA